MMRLSTKLAYLLGGLAVLVALAAGFWWWQQGQTSGSANQQIKAPHFIDSTPLHNDTYAAQPINVTLNFDFDVHEGSQISVTSANGEEWATGEVFIEDNQTALKRELRQGMPDGSYTVSYTVCWPDGSCHDGQFIFNIDMSLQAAYEDLRGQGEVRIDMHNLQFARQKVLISPGTQVTWVNQEEMVHFVNTETHPEHTYFPEQNSRGINNGGTYTTTFATPGQYDYHCSAHVPQGMLGSIVVAE